MVQLKPFGNDIRTTRARAGLPNYYSRMTRMPQMRRPAAGREAARPEWRNDGDRKKHFVSEPLAIPIVSPFPSRLCRDAGLHVSCRRAVRRSGYPRHPRHPRTVVILRNPILRVPPCPCRVILVRSIRLVSENSAMPCRKWNAARSHLTGLTTPPSIFSSVEPACPSRILPTRRR
jgi:hypothetical protein